MRPNPIRTKNARLNRAAAIVIETMRGGQCLYVEFNRMTGPRWCLSNGEKVAAEVAKRVIVNPQIVAGNDGLFPDTTPQTWRINK
jgi:hypothetical protein